MDRLKKPVGRHTALLVYYLCMPFLSVLGQDLSYVNRVVEKMAAPGMHGRGYVKDGDRKAAAFLCKEYRTIGLLPFGASYSQDFTININTFPGKMKCTVNHRTLTPGTDFTVSCNSPGIQGTFPLIWPSPPVTESSILDLANVNPDAAFGFLVVDDSLSHLKNIESLPYKGLVVLHDKKLWWHVSRCSAVRDWVSLDVKEEELPAGTPSISLLIENEYKTRYITQNVAGFVPGKAHPDTFLVFTAHYDHLGRMGKDAWFPGAHDNASGTAMMLDLARYYSSPENRPDFSMAFIAFSAEEAGLYGSQYYADHPLFPLGCIRFLINLDLVSTGVDGIMVVNGEVFQAEFDRLVAINQAGMLVKEVKKRGPAANSDHYPFYEKGVPSFFIYTLGAYGEYHTVDDKPEMLPFTAYNEFFTLLTRFFEHIE